MTNEQFQHNCCVFVWWFFFGVCMWLKFSFVLFRVIWVLIGDLFLFCGICCFLMLLGHVFFSVWLVHSIWRFVHFDKAAELAWQPVNDGFRLLCSFIMPAECLYIIWRHKFILFFFQCNNFRIRTNELVCIYNKWNQPKIVLSLQTMHFITVIFWCF